MKTRSTSTYLDINKLKVAAAPDRVYSARRWSLMLTYVRLACAICIATFLVSCAEQQPQHLVQSASAHRLHNVRTTAYTHTEKGCGRRNACGEYLSGRHLMSAASDWSRYPLGTRFKIVGTNDEYIIDDYGTALVGTNTIDLYKTSRLEMKRWGVRQVDIDVLQWGSRDQSLKVLVPRKKHPQVRRMIAALERQHARID
jgi:3D (Asp-Asp-Asp) domain-containing protein